MSIAEFVRRRDASATSRPTYNVTRWVFLRVLGVINCIAFVSLWVQIIGLVGSHGILPATEFLREVHGALGESSYRALPTLGWISASDGALHCMCGVGTAASVLLVVDFCPTVALLVAWICYLSLTYLGQDFLSFQWDILLLETDFLAIFWTPLQIWPRSPRAQAPPSNVVLWLLRWLLLRLMVESGYVKLASGDPNWHHLTALQFHYWTQPLPSPLAWYANQLPDWFQAASVVAVFVIELGVPWLMFAPRRARMVACGALVGLQALIALTGNYAFFNLLTMALCLSLLDDDACPWFRVTQLMRRRDASATMVATDQHGGAASDGSVASGRAWPTPVIVAVGVLLVWLSLPLPHAAFLRPLRLVNSYGLFAVMTTTRTEIVIEGSNDGKSWDPYEFRYKPGDPLRAPPLVAPHQPRLDWQMWFAALGDYQSNPWIVHLCQRLLEAEPQVLALLARNPFPQAPPRYIRASSYAYTFTRFGEGPAWWKRVPSARYLPEVSLRR